MNEQGKRALIPKLRFPEFRDAGGWEIKPFAKLFSIGNGRDHKDVVSNKFPHLAVRVGMQC
jgi:type I restriction enzyme S subunit